MQSIIPGTPFGNIQSSQTFIDINDVYQKLTSDPLLDEFLRLFDEKFYTHFPQIAFDLNLTDHVEFLHAKKEDKLKVVMKLAINSQRLFEFYRSIKTLSQQSETNLEIKNFVSLIDQNFFPFQRPHLDKFRSIFSLFKAGLISSHLGEPTYVANNFTTLADRTANNNSLAKQTNETLNNSETIALNHQNQFFSQQYQTLIQRFQEVLKENLEYKKTLEKAYKFIEYQKNLIDNFQKSDSKQ